MSISKCRGGGAFRWRGRAGTAVIEPSCPPAAAPPLTAPAHLLYLTYRLINSMVQYNSPVDPLSATFAAGDPKYNDAADSGTFVIGK